MKNCKVTLSLSLNDDQELKSIVLDQVNCAMVLTVKKT